jgi:hypothetical protein
MHSLLLRDGGYGLFYEAFSVWTTYTEDHLLSVTDIDEAGILHEPHSCLRNLSLS